ncbi:MAG: sensor histidine kinase [Lachnospiraceae bacterium]
MRYLTKIFLCFIGFSLVPMTLFLTSYYASVHFMETGKLDNSRQNVIDGEHWIDERLSLYADNLDMLAGNQDIINFLLTPDENSMIEANRKMYYYERGERNYISIYVVNRIQDTHIGTKEVPPVYTELKNRNWGIMRMVQGTEQAVLRVTDHDGSDPREVALTLAKQVIHDNEAIGYVLIDVHRSLFEEVFAPRFDTDTYIYQDNNLIFHSSRQREGLGSLPDYIRDNQENGSAVYGGIEPYKISIVYGRLSNSGLNIAQETSLREVSQAFSYMKMGLFASVLITITLCLMLSYIVARNVTEPIRKVTKTLKKVEQGDFEVRIDSNRSDEIGELIHGLNHMIVQTKRLIESIWEKQRMLDIAQNRALLAQVNPHFLYNTLDLIKWGARMNDLEMVSQVTINLGKLLRAIVNIQEDVITVREELDIIQLYINIQKLRYGERLMYEVTIPEELMERRIPRLLLQPLVENAIEHGLKNMSGIGKLRIEAEKDAEYLKLHIIDNGIGFEDQETEPKPNRDKLGGIGMQNVDSRAKLYGDSSSGITITTRADKATDVIVSILDMEG